MRLGMGSVAPNAEKVLPVAKVRRTLWPDVIRADDTLKSAGALLRFAPEKNHEGVAEMRLPGAEMIAFAVGLGGETCRTVCLLPEVPRSARHTSNRQQLGDIRRGGNDAAEGINDLAAPLMDGSLGLALIQQNAAIEVWPYEDDAKSRVCVNQAKSGRGSENAVRRQVVTVLEFCQALCHGSAPVRRRPSKRFAQSTPPIWPEPKGGMDACGILERGGIHGLAAHLLLVMPAMCWLGGRISIWKIPNIVARNLPGFLEDPGNRSFLALCFQARFFEQILWKIEREFLFCGHP